jgi:hypothetical protein
VLGSHGEDLAPVAVGAALQVGDQNRSRWSPQNCVVKGEVVTRATADGESRRRVRRTCG